MPESVRMCRVCRQRAPKDELLRWVVVDRQLEADAPQRRPGRGYYTDSDECAAKLPKVLKLTAGN